MSPWWALPKDQVASPPEGLQWQLVRVDLLLRIEQSPWSQEAVLSLDHLEWGSGMGDSCDKVELESPCPVILCSSTWWCQALLLLELWLWWHCLMSLRLRGTCPSGVTGWGGCIISIQPGNSRVRATSFFLSVSYGVGWTSGCPAGGSVGFPGKVIGSLSVMEVCGASVLPGPLAHSSGVSCLGIVPSRTASSVKVVRGLIAHLNLWMHLTKMHGWSSFGRLAFSAQYCRACAYTRFFCSCSSL